MRCWSRSVQHAMLAVGLGLWAVAGCSRSNPVVTIGLVAPLTGDQASIGQDLLHGAQLAVDQANAKNPVLPGYHLVVDAVDDQHSPSQAVSAAKKLVADPDVVAIGGRFMGGDGFFDPHADSSGYAQATERGLCDDGGRRHPPLADGAGLHPSI